MRLILHAGTHKTGTSSIQWSLNNNREWLRQRGYTYARFEDCPRSHNNFAHRLAASSDEQLGALRDELMGNVEPGRVLILSAEQFSVRTVWPRHWRRFDKPEYLDDRRAYVSRLRGLVSGFDEVTVFLCFRRQDQYAESLYATNLMSGLFRWSFEEFRARCAPIFDYRAKEKEFRGAFSDVRIANFDQKKKQDLIVSYFNWIDIPVPPDSGHRRKVTPDARLLYWLHDRVQDDPNRKLQRLRGRFCQSETAAETLSAGGRYSLWPSEEDRQAFVGQCTSPSEFSFAQSQSGAIYAALDRDELSAVDYAFENWAKTKRKAAVLPNPNLSASSLQERSTSDHS